MKVVIGTNLKNTEARYGLPNSVKSLVGKTVEAEVFRNVTIVKEHGYHFCNDDVVFENEKFSQSEKAEIKCAIDISEELFNKLFQHFIDNGEMPYGVAKARTSDPTNWISNHMHEVL